MKQESFYEHEDRRRIGTSWRVPGPFGILFSPPATNGARPRDGVTRQVAVLNTLSVLFVIRTALAR
jgi:hypothetical protein